MLTIVICSFQNSYYSIDFHRFKIRVSTKYDTETNIYTKLLYFKLLNLIQTLNRYYHEISLKFQKSAFKIL